MSDTDDLEQRVAVIESRLSDLEQLIHDFRNSGNVTDMREFVQEIEPKTHPERALAIAYYLEQYQGQQSFTSTDIKDGYRSCRVQKPANMSDVLAALEKKEWAMEDGKDGQTRLRRLTKNGLEKIEEEIDDGA